MNKNLKHETIHCELCVVGGGLAGSFAALAAARRGTKVVLMQDRPMLGGNASSEIRMWVRGAKGKFERESGLISELEERNIYANPTLVPALFDATLYGMLRENPNVTLLLNCSCADAMAENGHVISVTGWQTTTYTWYTVKADYFADCSGDSILAPLIGAQYRHGREAKAEYGETLTPDVADSCTMGMSVLLAARETDHPVPFTPPAFANVYPTDESFANGKCNNVHALARDHKIGTSGCNLWWVELGGDMDSIHDADRVRDELLASIYGVWDHIKNRGDHGFENWELEWVGFLPGKRESRRYVGDHVLTEGEILAGGSFEDVVAFGGWPLDDHNPHGMRQIGEDTAPSVCIPTPNPYGIPYRVLYAPDFDNFFFAGRNISATHAALSSTRVMATCSLLGQAMGTAAALASAHKTTPRGIYEKHLAALQKALQEDDMFLPGIPVEYSEILTRSGVNLTDEQKAILFNGIERPRTAMHENSVEIALGYALTFTFDAPTALGTLRLRFDPDFSRESISPNKKMRVFAQKLHTGKDFVPVKVAATLPKGFDVLADGRVIFSTDSNHRSAVKLPLNVTAKELSILFRTTNGADTVRLYGIDLI